MKDRQQVTVADPTRQRRGAQRLVDHPGAMELGQGDRLGHLGAHSAGAGRGGLDQPRTGTITDGQERLLGRGPRLWGPLAWRLGPRRVVRLAQDGLAALPAWVPGDLSGAGLVDHGDHDLVAGVADPDPLDDVDQLVGDRIAHPAEGDGAVPADRAGLPERDCDRLGWQGCSRVRSWASSSAGGRPVTRCGRVLTSSQNPWQAASSSTKVV